VIAPSLGRIVHVLIDPAKNNGSDVAMAFVTRTWGESVDADGTLRHTVNLRVVTDTFSDLPSLTSVYLYDERPTAETLTRLYPQNVTGRGSISFWPPRV
jgi:hypothetical protein